MKIPEFKTKEEEAEFWETHDTTDYMDDLEEIDVKIVDKRKRRTRIYKL